MFVDLHDLQRLYVCMFNLFHLQPRDMSAGELKCQVFFFKFGKTVLLYNAIQGKATYKLPLQKKQNVSRLFTPSFSTNLRIL